MNTLGPGTDNAAPPGEPMPPSSTRTSGTHRCPGCSRTGIPDRIFACRSCWHELPASLQRRITVTVTAPPAQRLPALRAAAEFYASRKAPSQ